VEVSAAEGGFSLVTVLIGIGVLLMLVMLVAGLVYLRMRKKAGIRAREVRANAISMALSVAEPAELAAQAGCTVEEAAQLMNYIGTHNQAAARLAAISAEAQKLNFIDATQFLRLMDSINQRLSQAMNLFMQNSMKEAGQQMELVITDVSDREKRLKQLQEEDEAISKQLEQLPAIRARLGEITAELEEEGSIDLSEEKSRVARVLKTLEKSEASVREGKQVRLPDIDAFKKILDAKNEKIVLMESTRFDLPEIRERLNALLIAILKATHDGAPIEKEQLAANEMLGRIIEVEKQLALGRPEPARNDLDKISQTIEELAPAVELKAALPEQYDSSIEDRIALLLESWKTVTPDMLVELPEDCREWAVVRFYKMRKDDQPILLRGKALVTPQATSESAILAQASTDIAGDDPGETQKQTVTTGAGGRMCSRCQIQLKENQQFCGICGTMVVL
jgi:hypothetical protein